MRAEPELRQGSADQDWVHYLRQLINQHYQQSVVAETGEFDEALVAVVRHLQEQNGLSPDGVVNNAVWAVLVDGSGQDDQHFSMTIADLPEVSRVMGHDYLGQFFDIHGQEAGVSPELATRLSIEPGSDRCGEQRRNYYVAVVAMGAAAEEFARSPGIGTGVALAVALIAVSVAMHNWRECLGNDPQLPPGMAEELERSHDQLMADLERLRNTLPAGSVA
jgi:peptidoglycan hydrolase-like protein with peptidoglycan-binding domain